MKSLTAACEGFAATECLIVESDSTDDTVANAVDAASRNGWRFETLGALRDRMPERTARLAHCRNHLRDLIESDYAHVDYVVLADLDGVNLGVERAAIESAWSRSEPWSVMTANQEDGYYDIWALRHPNWCPGDCWADYHAMRSLIGKEAARDFAVHSRQISLSPRLPPVECDSAFGGLAIYTRDAALAGRYVGLTTDGNEVCEHVSFHAGLRRKGHKIYINPKLVNRTQEEHRSRTKFAKLTQRISRIFTWSRLNLWEIIYFSEQTRCANPNRDRPAHLTWSFCFL